ncbi:MAG TPA: VUT family protein [Gaiellaceae bacterium]|nr:VUT family protein [Gaiellaceae bacterium]
MRLAALTGLYVAVVCSAQIGANKVVRLPFTHLDAPGGVYSIGIALALVQLAHHSGVTRRDGALNAQLMIGTGFAGSAVLAAYIAIVVHSHPAFPNAAFDRAVGSTWRIVGSSLAAFIVSETVDNLVGAPLRGRVHDAVRVVASSAVSAPIDSAVFLVLAFGSSGLDFFDGQLVGKIASAVLIGIPLVVLGRRLLPAPLARADTLAPAASADAH